MHGSRLLLAVPYYNSISILSMLYYTITILLVLYYTILYML